MASFSPSLSQASSTLITPQRQTQQQQAGGFSLFGGKAHSTPSDSSTRSERRPPLSSHNPIGNSTPASSHAGMSSGVGGSVDGGGLPRFKTRARTRQEEEDEREAFGRRGRGSGSGETMGHHSIAVRGTISPSSSLLSPTQRDDSAVAGGGGLHTFTTPSPSSVPPNRPLDSATATRKRLRAPSTAAAGTRPATSGALQSTPIDEGGGGDGALPVARTWGGGMDASRGGGAPQQQQRRRQASPRPTRGGTGPVMSGTPSSSSRSPRPARKRPPSQSPRGTGGVGFSSPQSQQPPPMPRRYELADFEGADDVCFNPGEEIKSVTKLLLRDSVVDGVCFSSDAQF